MNRYTANDLAHMVGTTARTVRFYVSEKLVDAPIGRGRGRHFNDSHLTQLKRVLFLQSAGLDLAQIRAHAAELKDILEKRGLSLENAEKSWELFVQNSAAVWKSPDSSGVSPLAERVTRLTVAPGLELLVGGSYRIPPPEVLEEISTILRRNFRLIAQSEVASAPGKSPKHATKLRG